MKTSKTLLILSLCLLMTSCVTESQWMNSPVWYHPSLPATPTAQTPKLNQDRAEATIEAANAIKGLPSTSFPQPLPQQPKPIVTRYEGTVTDQYGMPVAHYHGRSEPVSGPADIAGAMAQGQAQAEQRMAFNAAMASQRQRQQIYDQVLQAAMERRGWQLTTNKALVEIGLLDSPYVEKTTDE